MTDMLLDESAPGRLTPEHCCVSHDQNCLALQISKRRTPVYTRVGITVLAILALGQPAKPQARNSFDGFALVDKSGNIKKPADYRDLYQALGTYFVLDPKGGIRCT